MWIGLKNLLKKKIDCGLRARNMDQIIKIVQNCKFGNSNIKCHCC